MEDSYVFQPSFLEAAQMLDDAQRLQFYDALNTYGVYGEMPEDIDPVIKAIVIACIPTIDSAKARREYGKKGGAPKGNQNAKKTTENNLNQPKVVSKTTSLIIDEDVDVDVNEDVDDKKEKSKPEKNSRFTPPSPQDISAYCHEKGYSFDTNRFFDYYESNGWMVGKNKMKDWKAAVRSWAAREHPPDIRSGTNKRPKYMQRDTESDPDFGTKYLREVTS